MSCGYNKTYGAGVGSSRNRVRPEPSSPTPTSEPIKLQDLPTDILAKIFFDHKALEGVATDTYSEQLLLAKNIDPALAIAKEAIAPEVIETHKNGTIQTFTNIQEVVNKHQNQIIEADYIKIKGKSIEVLIPKGVKIMYINMIDLDTRLTTISLRMKYEFMQGNPLHIMINDVVLRVFLYDKDPPMISVPEMIVGASWLHYIFPSIQCISSFKFSSRDHIQFTLFINNFPMDISTSEIEAPVELINKLLLLLEHLEKRVIQKKRRIGGSLTKNIQKRF